MKEYLLSSVDRSQSFTGSLSTVDLTGEEADTFFDALASATTRELLAALYDEPATATELAERSETSLQNVHYHLEKLEAADLIEPVDMVYSSRGREVDVYGPTNRAIVLVAGEASMVQSLKAGLARFVGVLAVLAVGALLVQSVLVGGPLLEPLAPGGEPVGGGQKAPPAVTRTPTHDFLAGDAGGDASGPVGESGDETVGANETAPAAKYEDATVTPTATANETATSTADLTARQLRRARG